MTAGILHNNVFTSTEINDIFDRLTKHNIALVQWYVYYELGSTRFGGDPLLTDNDGKTIPFVTLEDAVAITHPAFKGWDYVGFLWLYLADSVCDSTGIYILDARGRNVTEVGSASMTTPQLELDNHAKENFERRGWDGATWGSVRYPYDPDSDSPYTVEYYGTPDVYDNRIDLKPLNPGWIANTIKDEPLPFRNLEYAISVARDYAVKTASKEAAKVPQLEARVLNNQNISIFRVQPNGSEIDGRAPFTLEHSPYVKGRLNNHREPIGAEGWSTYHSGEATLLMSESAAQKAMQDAWDKSKETGVKSAFRIMDRHGNHIGNPMLPDRDKDDPHFVGNHMMTVVTLPNQEVTKGYIFEITPEEAKRLQEDSESGERYFVLRQFYKS